MNKGDSHANVPDYCLDRLNDLVVVVNSSDRLQFANSSFGKAIGKKRYIGNHIICYVAKGFQDHMMKCLTDARKTGKSGISICLRTKQGKKEYNFSAVSLRDGKKPSVVLSGREISYEERVLKEIWDKAPVAYHRLNKKGIIVDVNETEAKLLGYKIDEMIGRSIFNFVIPSQRAGAKKRFKLKLKGKHVQHAEDRLYLKKDGKKIHVNIDDTLEYDGKGKVCGIRTTMSDITYLKVIESKLKKSEEEFKSVFNNSAVSIMVANKDEKIVSWNPFTETLLGFSKKDLYMKPVNSFYPKDEWVRIRKSKIRDKGYMHHLETKMYNKNKKCIDVDISISVLKDAKGSITGSIGVIRNITERKKAEEIIKTSEEKFKSVFQNSAVAITVTDEKERIISWNPFTEHLLGKGKKELFMRPVSLLYPLSEWRKIRKQNIRKMDKVYNLETKMIRSNNKLVDVDMSISVLKDTKGNVTGSVAIMSDITERKIVEEEREKYTSMLEKQSNELKQANLQLVRAQKELELEKNSVEKKVIERTKKLNQANIEIMSLLEQKDAFIGRVAHDLKTPLTAVFGSLQVLELMTKDKKSREFIDEAISNGRYLNRLLNDILTLARLNSEREMQNLEKVNVSTIVHETIDNNRVVFASKGIRIKRDIKSTHDVWVDSIKIKEVVNNIISNAYKFVLKDPMLIFSVTQTKNHVKVSIKDNGIGMKQTIKDKIFEEFFKEDESRHDLSAGLGLSICKNIIEQQGGRIWATSPGLGRGSIFSFTIPLKKPMVERE